MKYNTEVLKSNPCDFNDAFILVRSDIISTAHNIATALAFINCTPFTKFITKIDGTTIDDAKDLELAMVIYNLIEFSPKYSEAIGSSWVYSKR